MPRPSSAYLIEYDEPRRVSLLEDVSGARLSFSDALSKSDWPIRSWEVCGLSFRSGHITHWALAQRGATVATGKVRVHFTNVTPAEVALSSISNKMGATARYMARASSGRGGPLPPATWAAMKAAIRNVHPDAFDVITRLERMKDQSAEPDVRLGYEIVAQQRDATGLALDAFEPTGTLRKRTLLGWVPPEKGARLHSFIEGIGPLHAIEDQLIARDCNAFPGATDSSATVSGRVFQIGGRNIEVVNVNRTRIEHSLGVDLLYYNQTYNAWTLIQYKCMEPSPSSLEFRCRVDAGLRDELARMSLFRTNVIDQWAEADGVPSFRLCGDGFYLKFLPRVHLQALAADLLKGMYIPRRYLQSAIQTGALRGDRGGDAVTYDRVERHFNNTQIAHLIHDGWIGTRGISSDAIKAVIQESVERGRSLVVARAHADDDSDLEATLEMLGL